MGLGVAPAPTLTLVCPEFEAGRFHHLDEGRTPACQQAGVSAFPGAQQRVQRLLEALLVA